jgi:hypothetical protein
MDVDMEKQLLGQSAGANSLPGPFSRISLCRMPLSLLLLSRMLLSRMSHFIL